MVPRKPKKSDRTEVVVDPTAVWHWPPLEPGETEEMREERIFQTLTPFIEALAVDQATRDHEAEVASRRQGNPGSNGDQGESAGPLPALGEVIRFPNGHYEVRGMVDGRYVVRVRNEARGTQKYEVWTEEERHQFDDAKARKRSELAEQADRIDRNQQIYERSLAGEAMKSLAMEFGLSTTRIRTIVGVQGRKERGRSS